MDINTLRGIATIVVMVTFIGICLWAYSSKRRKHFDEASNLPFADDPYHGQADTIKKTNDGVAKIPGVRKTSTEPRLDNRHED